MHDPSVVVFDVHVPIPVRSRFDDSRPDERRWSLGRFRRTNPENLGEPVYPWWNLDGWRPKIAGRGFRWLTLATVWHEEPNGADSGTVCKGMGGTELTWHNVKWAWKHRKHLSIQIRPYLRVRSWLFDRCDECGHRFFWKQARFGAGWDSPKVLHEKCSTLRMKRGEAEDLKKYIQFDASDNERFRVESMYLADKKDASRE